MLEQLLTKHFNFKTFRKGQRAIIEDILDGHDVFAMLPTGTGKSLCYLLPGYIMQGIVIIVSPLLSLMEDQVQQIKKNGEKRVAALNSFLSQQEKLTIIKHLNHYRFLFISPEMLQSQQLLKQLRLIKVSLFVIDEAHCISQWGYEFRPDYLKLSTIRESIGSPPCLALTATATERIQLDIVDQLNLKQPKIHIYSVDRENISLVIKKLENTEEKINELLYIVKTLKGPGIVYVSSREWAEKLSDILASKLNYRTAYYHGGLLNEDRLLIQNQFVNNQLDVICSTNAFGMGINKPDVRFVVHFHYPAHINAYIQEIGRAGRDGEPSCSFVLYTNHDHQLPERLIDHGYPTNKELSIVFSLLRDKSMRDDFENTLFDIGFEESIVRFLSYHLSDLLNKEYMSEEELIFYRKQINQQIAERKLVKFQELNAMRQWLEGDGCRRQSYLTIFGEEHKKPIHNCCDHCGVDLSILYKTRQDITSEQHFFDWNIELKKLLHQDVNK